MLSIIRLSNVYSETLAWDPNPEPDIAGYRVFYGEVNSSPLVVEVGNVTSRTFTNLVAGHSYFFYVTAYNNAGLESDPSQTLTYTKPAAANQPPTISSVANQTILEDSAPVAASFTVGDPDTALSSLVLSALSSNTALIANSSLSFGGSGASRTLTYRPQPDQSGTATISISVSDGQASATSSFTVTVAPVNDPPTISSVSDRTIAMNGTTGPLPVVVADKETSAGSLTLTAQSSNGSLVPQSGLILGGSGANRTISVTPARDQVGQATITVTVNDGQASASDSFVVTVTGSPSGGTIPNYLLVEDFEAPGYEASGWFELGNPSETFRSKLEGRYGLNTAKGSEAYRSLSGATNVDLYFMLSWKNTSQTHTLIDLSDAAGQPAGFLWISGGELRATHGTSTVGAPFSYSNRPIYHFWVEWERGSGANGRMLVFVSETGEKPTAPVVALTDGDGQAADQLYFGGAAPDSPSLIFDKVRLADGPIGSNPQ